MHGIVRRLDEAAVKLAEGALENALIQILPATDKTAKQKYSSKFGNKKRNIKFFTEHEDFLIHGLLGFESTLWVKGTMKFGDYGTLPEALYTYARCPLLHEGDLTENISLTKKDDPAVFGMDNGRLVFGEHFVFALMLIIIGDPTNRNLSFSRPWIAKIKDIELDLNKYWGLLPAIKQDIGYKDMDPDFFVNLEKLNA